MSAGALSFDDPAWERMLGGYRVPYDPREALRTLERGGDTAKAWDELWNELHHQGDVGEASYAAVPHLVRIYLAGGVPDWNTYVMVQTIDEARRDGAGRNPDLPAHIQDAYHAAFRQLAIFGLDELQVAEEPVLVSGIIAVVATWKGQFMLGRLAWMFDEVELKELLVQGGWA